MSSTRNIRSLFAKAVLALALAGILGAIAAPARADDRRRYHHPPGWRPHPVYVAPAPVYAPPAVVYTPPVVSPGINLVIPLHIR